MMSEGPVELVGGLRWNPRNREFAPDAWSDIVPDPEDAFDY
jgi:hypothetical protein